MLASSIQNFHSASGTMISALGKTRSLSLSLMPLMWSGWKCEMTMRSIACWIDAGGDEIGAQHAGGRGDLAAGAGVDQDELLSGIDDQAS